MTQVNRIALVGHCGPDAAMLKHTLMRFADGAEVELVTDADRLEQVAGPEALLLVNRVLDGRFEDSGGIELIRALAGRDRPPRLMLISNFAESQAEAQAAGAWPGFGKSELGGETMQARLAAAMNGQA